MSLRDRITDDMKAAMRAKDAPLLSTIRLLLSAIKQKEVDERIVVDDSQVLAILEKLIKQRRDSIEQFRRGNRQDLVDQETFELTVLSAYQPEQAGAVRNIRKYIFREHVPAKNGHDDTCKAAGSEYQSRPHLPPGT